MSTPWSFYAAPMSYFSAKVRPALQYKKIEFAEIWPTRDVQKAIRAATGVGFIPVIETDDGEVLQDSPRMLERIEELVPEPPIFPEDASVRMVAEVIQDFCDDVFVPQALHWRWSFPEQRQWVEDDWTAVFGSMAGKLAEQMSSALPFVGVTEKTRDAHERWFHHVLDILQAHFSESRYVLGDVITVADYALFGPFFPHFARDPVPARVVRDRAPLVMAWLHEVTAAGPPSPWACPPEVKPSLVPLLAEIGKVFVPQALAVADFVTEAVSTMPAGEDAPRILGILEQNVFGVTEQRVANAYTVWRHQRTAARYATLSPGDRSVVDEILGPCGVLPYLQKSPAARLVMDGFQLRIGSADEDDVERRRA